MVSVRELQLSDELSSADLDDVSQDIKRMIRRARASKRARLYLNNSVEQLSTLLNQQTQMMDDVSLDDLLTVIDNHREEAFQAINPFVSFFYSDGLLPGEVSENALMLYVLNQCLETGHVPLS